jgi:hypothetical protein
MIHGLEWNIYVLHWEHWCRGKHWWRVIVTKKLSLTHSYAMASCVIMVIIKVKPISITARSQLNFRSFAITSLYERPLEVEISRINFTNWTEHYRSITEMAFIVQRYNLIDHQADQDFSVGTKRNVCVTVLMYNDLGIYPV